MRSLVPHRRHLRALAVVTALALAGPALALGCGGDAQGKQGEGKGKGKGRGKGKGKGKGRWGDKGPDEDEGPAFSIRVTSLTPATIKRYYTTSGTLKARRSAELVAVQSAIITDLLVEEGDTVQRDQQLAKLDGRSFRLQAALDRLSAKNARQELDRLESIRHSDAVARQELDAQRFALESALATSRLSKHQISLTEIRAPFDGTITARHVDIGNLASTASPLYSLADLSALDLELHLPEREAATVTVGAPVDIELLDGSTFSANVLRRAPVVDALTGTVKFTVRTETFPDAAVPGAFARAKVLVDTRAATPSLPVTAVFDLEGTPHVYTVVEGNARRVPVELGLQGDARVEITAGLKDDASVIVDAREGVAEGMEVTPVPEEADLGANKQPAADEVATPTTETAPSAASPAKAGAGSKSSSAKAGA